MGCGDRLASALPALAAAASDYLQRNVAAQQADPGSLLHFTKRLLALRRNIPPCGVVTISVEAPWHAGLPAQHPGAIRAGGDQFQRPPG